MKSRFEYSRSFEGALQRIKILRRAYYVTCQQTPRDKHVTRDKNASRCIAVFTIKKMRNVRCSFVCFDLETTGLTTPDILQISGLSLLDGDTFDSYALPVTKAIEPASAEITGFSLENGILYKKLRNKKKVRVYTEPVLKILSDFVEWLRSMKFPVFLTAYNAFKFDAKVLLNHLDRYNIRQGCMEWFSKYLANHKHWW